MGVSPTGCFSSTDKFLAYFRGKRFHSYRQDQGRKRWYLGQLAINLVLVNIVFAINSIPSNE